MSVSTKTSITLTGISGKNYQFDVYPKSLNWNSVPGVYIILKKNPSGNFGTIYVGETDNLGERISGHYKLNCFERNGWTHLGFLHEKDGNRRLFIEQDILQKYNWVCND